MKDPCYYTIVILLECFLVKETLTPKVVVCLSYMG